MVSKGGVTLLYLCLTALLARVTFSLMDEATCLSRGFVSNDLKCSTCELMMEFNLEEIAVECRQCCQKVEEKKVSKYSRAILEICK